MAQSIKNIKVTWGWSGDDSKILGYNVAITKTGQTPNEECVCFAKSGTTDKEHTFTNVTVDNNETYIGWVQACYFGKDSSWQSNGVLTIPDDGDATITTGADDFIMPSDEGLVAYYSFDDGTAKDNSDNGNDGTIHGCTSVNGVSGRGMNFDGVTNYIGCGSISLNNTITASCFIKAESFNHTNDPTIGAHIFNGSASGFRVYVEETAGRLQCWFSNSNNSLTVFQTEYYPNINEIIHIAFTHDGMTAKLYANGNLVGTNATASNNFAGDFLIGMYRSSGYNFKGITDEVRVYNRALSHKEIRGLYKYPSGLSSGVQAAQYADAAELTAINAAQAKADAAETTAKAYADGIVSDEEARAIADATAKANAAQTAAQNYAYSQGLKAGNLLNPYKEWQPGVSGNQGSFSCFGDIAENSITIEQGPFGTQDLIWNCIPDANSGEQGGWNNYFSIDSTKTYIFGCYFQKINSTGSFLFGPNNPVNSLDNIENTNPYFNYTYSLPTYNKWYLCIGVLHNENYTGESSGLGGIYDVETGKLIGSNTEFKSNSGITAQRQKAYCWNYTTGDGSTIHQKMARPFVYEASKFPGVELLTNKITTITPGADVTADNTAAAIANQGSLATQSTVDLSSEVTNKSLAVLDSTANTKLGTIATGADVTDYTDTRVANSISENSVTTIKKPLGATFSSNSSSYVGAIKITLPQSWTNTMIKFTVDVFNYVTNKSFSAEIAGYNYTSGNWYNISVNISGSTLTNYTVRFGHDGSKCCVWIGELTSTWTYPKISVRDFQAGHSSFYTSYWDDGWSIGIVTSFNTVTNTISNNLIDANSIVDQGNLATLSLDADDYTSADGIITVISGDIITGTVGLFNELLTNDATIGCTLTMLNSTSKILSNTITSYDTDGTGIYIDGAGNFRFGTVSNSVLTSGIIFDAADGDLYISGNITATSGTIGGWGINDYNIYSASGKVYLDATQGGIYVYPNTGLAKLISIGNVCNGAAYTGNNGISAIDMSNNYLFRLDDSVCKIAGWNFDYSKLYSDNIELYSAGYIREINNKWRLNADGSGQLAGGNITWDSDGNATFAGNITTSEMTSGTLTVSSGGTLQIMSSDEVSSIVISNGLIKYRKELTEGYLEADMLSKTLSGVADNGSTVTLDNVFFRSEPKIIVSPKRVSSWDKDYSGYSQQLKCGYNNLLYDADNDQLSFDVYSKLVLEEVVTPRTLATVAASSYCNIDSGTQGDNNYYFVYTDSGVSDYTFVDKSFVRTFRTIGTCAEIDFSLYPASMQITGIQTAKVSYDSVSVLISALQNWHTNYSQYVSLCSEAITAKQNGRFCDAETNTPLENISGVLNHFWIYDSISSSSQLIDIGGTLYIPCYKFIPTKGLPYFNYKLYYSYKKSTDSTYSEYYLAYQLGYNGDVESSYPMPGIHPYSYSGFSLSTLSINFGEDAIWDFKFKSEITDISYSDFEFSCTSSNAYNFIGTTYLNHRKVNVADYQDKPLWYSSSSVAGATMDFNANQSCIAYSFAYNEYAGEYFKETALETEIGANVGELNYLVVG